MRKISLFVILLTFTLFVSSQTQKYSKVKVYFSESTFDRILKSGIPLENAFIEKNEYLIGEYSEYDIKKLKSNGFNVDILVDDMKKFYQERNNEPISAIQKEKKNWVHERISINFNNTKTF